MIHIVTPEQFIDMCDKEMTKKLQYASSIINKVGNDFLELVKLPIDVDECVDPLKFIILLNGAEIFDKYNYEDLNKLYSGIVQYRKSLNAYFEDVLHNINEVLEEKKEKPLEDMTKEELLEYIKKNK